MLDREISAYQTMAKLDYSISKINFVRGKTEEVIIAVSTAFARVIYLFSACQCVSVAWYIPTL